ncbi:MAG: molybdenum cofactor biosynthesis protein MoaE [Promethearchaeota archaeon]
MTDQIKNSIKSGIYPKGEFTLEEIIQSIKNHHLIKKVGSIHTFSGIVRETSKNNKPVKGIKIDAYIELANQSINKICEDIKKQLGIIEIVLIHFYGEFELSEELVYVVVASGHREEGFKALRSAVERYKKEIAVWKREDFQDGTSEWVHQ